MLLIDLFNYGAYISLRSLNEYLIDNVDIVVSACVFHLITSVTKVGLRQYATVILLTLPNTAVLL